MQVKRFGSVAAALAVLLALAVPSRRTAAASSSGDTLTVGAILPVTGAAASWAVSRRAALELGVDDVNQAYAGLGLRRRVRLVVEDSQLDPQLAVAKLRRLAARGIRTVLGPATSAELAAMRPIANSLGVMVLSGDSTASTLALPNDDVFRFVPDDTLEARSIVALLDLDGMRVLVGARRGDLGNDDIYLTTQRALEAQGGTLVQGPRYSPDTTDYGPVVAALANQVRAAEGVYGVGSVGVFLSSFGEAVSIFRLAKDDPTLARVRWYGTDDNVRIPEIASDPDAAAFAARVGFPCPVAGLDDAYRSLWEPLSARIQARTGSPPDAFTLAIYDALWVGVLADQQAGRRTSAAARKTAIMQTANRFVGATGWTLLDRYGDRAIGNFDFWAVRPVDSGYQWIRVARYVNGQIHPEAP